MGRDKDMRKLMVVVTLLGLAGLLYIMLVTQENDELAGPAATREADSAAKSGATSAGAASNAAVPGSASNLPATESGSKPAPIQMSTTGIIIGGQGKRDAPAPGDNGR